MTKEQQLEKMLDMIDILNQLWEAGCEVDDTIIELRQLAEVATEGRIKK